MVRSLLIFLEPCHDLTNILLQNLSIIDVVNCTITWIQYICAAREAFLINRVTASPTSSHIESEHRAHSNKSCMVLLTSAHYVHSALACSTPSATVVQRCLFWLVHICLFITKILLVKVLDGILSLTRFFYPSMNLWRAEYGISSLVLVKQEGGLGTPLSCSSLYSFLYRLLIFPLSFSWGWPLGAGLTGILSLQRPPEGITFCD